MLLDFRILHPLKDNQLFKKWPVLCEKVARFKSTSNFQNSEKIFREYIKQESPNFSNKKDASKILFLF